RGRPAQGYGRPGSHPEPARGDPNQVMSGVILNRPDGSEEYVDATEVDAALAAGYTPRPGDTATSRRRSGSTQTIDAASLGSTLTPGVGLVGGDQRAADFQARHAEEAYGGVTGGLGALGLGAARGLTFGLSDLVVDDEYARGVQAENPWLDLGGTVAGAIATGNLTGLTKGALSLGTRLAPGSKAAAALIGGATEGAAFGAGVGTSNLILRNEPLTAESVFAEYRTQLFMGGAGGGLGGLAGHGLSRLGGKIADDAARRAADTDPEKALLANAEPGTVAIDSAKGKVLTEDFVTGLDRSSK